MDTWYSKQNLTADHNTYQI